MSTVEARRRSLAGQSHLDPVVHRATRGPTSPTSSYVSLRDPFTLQRLHHLASHPFAYPPSRSGRYTGSCDPRRGKLSTLAPRLGEREKRGERKRASCVTSDICGLFDRQTALSLFRTRVAELRFFLSLFLLSFIPSSFSATYRVCPRAGGVEVNG